jgi:hypothetical protein
LPGTHLFNSVLTVKHKIQYDVRNQRRQRNLPGLKEATNGARPMSKKLWQVLLQAALETSEVEITCMDCFNLLDQYADLLLDGTDPQDIMPSVRQHLHNCPICTQEFETLLLMLREAAQQSGVGSG